MAKSILTVHGSMRKAGSRSRFLATALQEHLQSLHGRGPSTTRHLADGVPFVDAAWIEANFTDPCERSAEQRAILARSDALFSELKETDILVLGTPIYNFGVPAAVKAWIDMITRAKEAFRYTTDGPEGLLLNKKAYVVLTSGGTKAGSDIDFAWPYLRHVLSFIGITDVDLIASDLLGMDTETANAAALKAIKSVS